MTEALKVLNIEDDPDVRLGCVQALQLEGIPAESVASAEAAGARLELRGAPPGCAATRIYRMARIQGSYS